jgi:replication factor C small subunit
MNFTNIWTERYRPQKLSDLLISDENRKIFESFRTSEEIPNLLLTGIQGCGKTSAAKIIVRDILQCQYLYLNCSDENGIDTARNKISTFAQTKSIDGKIKVILCDEFDNFTGEGQRCLRNTMEEFSSITRFILTGNYKYKIILPIQSRCQEFEIIPTLEQCVHRCYEILKKESVTVSETQKIRLIELVRTNYPDLRKCINEIQKHSTDKVLNIPENKVESLLSEIFSLVKSKKIQELRKFLIENEGMFNGDYQNLLRKLFNYVDKEEKNTELKKYYLLVLAEHIYRSVFCLDNEINTYACLINLCEK